MKKQLLLSLLIIFSVKIMVAQQVSSKVATHPAFDTKLLNEKINEAFIKSQQQQLTKPLGNTAKPQVLHSASAILQKMEEVKTMDFNKLSHPVGGAKVYDTVFVGLVPHDTLWITGVYNHQGPIFVFNDAVLVIHNAIVNNDGDLFVFGHGKVFADSSSITFPQQYFYQRTLLAVQNAYLYYNFCSFNYSGMSHGLFMGDSAHIDMVNVHNYDFTTAGLYGYSSVNIHGSNMGGEYIMSGNSTANFNHVDTLLLWHQFPNFSVVNYAFPQGDTVYGYHFNNGISGIAGINYNVNADSCHQVWWGMMPANGSDVTISNSTIRSIGALFERGDSVSVSGVNDNSSYTNFVMPVADRNLHLINSSVQTWSFYLTDTCIVNINNCNLGEVGTQQRSVVNANQLLLDGSGGYFWATDTSTTIAVNSTVYSTARSERHAIFLLAYSTMPYTGPTSIGNSVIASIQNTLAAEPLPYDGSVAWLENISASGTAHADSLINIGGSVWIDQGPNGQGAWLDFASYSLYYQLQGNTAWTAIVIDSALEIRNASLGRWNTCGLTPGTYVLRLVGRSNNNDTLEDFKLVNLLPAAPLSVNENDDHITVSCFPNPAGNQLMIESSSASIQQIKIYDVPGKLVYQSDEKQNKISIDIHYLDKGVYFVETTVNTKKHITKLVKQ